MAQCSGKSSALMNLVNSMPSVQANSKVGRLVPLLLAALTLTAVKRDQDHPLRKRLVPIWILLVEKSNRMMARKTCFKCIYLI